MKTPTFYFKSDIHNKHSEWIENIQGRHKYNKIDSFNNKENSMTAGEELIFTVKDRWKMKQIAKALAKWNEAAAAEYRDGYERRQKVEVDAQLNPYSSKFRNDVTE